MAGSCKYERKQCRGSGWASLEPGIIIWFAGEVWDEASLYLTMTHKLQYTIISGLLSPLLYKRILFSVWWVCKKCTWLHMQGPTVSPVFCKRGGRIAVDYYAIVICVPKRALYKSVQQLRAVSHDIYYKSIGQCYLNFKSNSMFDWRIFLSLDTGV